ncbi:carboxylesterase family protein [Mucilaginibacter pocheonensis]|uniref:Peptidase n=1 Tax=Mucilaginibacter pocheonensis TaxID=398050 RepID=A0ABU1T4P8_9SPHI|nr:hypothetical protein [Mucilaginibacter pocheonensis]MDR6940328.1 hypothetical protein [Mucilaginibacter pocheonensis]
MNKNHYSLLIFFFALTTACGLLQSLISFKIGAGIYTLDAIVLWVIGIGIISFAESVFLLKYFHYRKYWFAFYAASVALITNLCFLIVVCCVLISKQLVSYYKPVAIVYLCAGIIYAISLMFSGSRKTLWLKTAGVYGLVIGLILLSVVIRSTLPQPNTNILERITQWTSLAANLVPVLFILHLITEIKLLKTEEPDIPISERATEMFGLVKTLALIVTIGLGTVISYQCYSQIYWGKRNFENTKALARLFEARAFVNSKGDTLRYRLLKPLNYDPQKSYPLVVCLPYGGQPGTDTIRQIEGAAAAEILSTDINRKKYPAFIFVPNCPAGSGWGGVPNYPSVDTLVYKAINALDTAFSIDAKRRYVTGISRGGYGSWHFICTRPDMFAAAIPVCGGEDPELASKIVNVSVWAFHGAKDQNVPVSGSRGMIEGMKKAGLKPKYTEYPHEGHNIWYQVSITPGLWDWLFAQKRI